MRASTNVRLSTNSMQHVKHTTEFTSDTPLNDIIDVLIARIVAIQIIIQFS